MDLARALLARAQRESLALPERDVAIALLDWGGDGPLALLHHATGFCKGVWAPIAERLRARFRVIALDARGHGDSSIVEGAAAYEWREFGNDLIAVAERLAARHGRIGLGMGHSFGGTAFLAASKARPELFERIVLVDPVVHVPQTASAAPEVPRENPLSAGARKRRSEWPSLAEARASWLQRPILAAWRPEALDLYVLDGLRERADGSVTLKCPANVEAAIFEMGPHLDVAGIIRDHPTRTLWLHAGRGQFPVEMCRSLVRSMREARFETLDAGHLMVMEQPDLVSEAVLRFCAE